MKQPLGHVTKWTMTEEERLAYIKKHPIRPTEKPKGTSFNPYGINYEALNEKKKEGREKAKEAKAMKKDYKWRSEKAAEASKKARSKDEEEVM